MYTPKEKMLTNSVCHIIWEIKRPLSKLSSITKGLIKSEDTVEFSRLKKIFQISLQSYYTQYMTMKKYLYNLLYCKLENPIIVRFN